MDREKVIKGYMICVEHGLLNGEDCHGYHQWKDNHYEIEKINDYSKGCPYNGCETGCVKTLAKDTLALLKEQPQIVRCKDCINYNSLMRYCNDGSSYTKPNFFCADGKKKFVKEQCDGKD